jgi:membrane-bound metal-dependent hydrolase YbcI (DUF457 family)
VASRFGGILGSVAALVAAGFWLHRRPSTASSALLAGAMTVPGAYTLRFLLEGRGHDGTEFQEAQAALGLSYPGHAIDRLFYGLFAVAAVFWVWRTRARPTLWLVCRLLVGAVAAVAAIVLLQSVNNAVFDPLLQPKPKQTQPIPGRGERPISLLLRGAAWTNCTAIASAINAVGPIHARRCVGGTRP